MISWRTDASFAILDTFVYTNSALFQHPTQSFSILGDKSHFAFSLKQRFPKIQAVNSLVRDASFCQLDLLMLDAAIMPSSIQKLQIVKRLKMSVTYLTRIVMAKGTSLSPKVLPLGLKIGWHVDLLFSCRSTVSHTADVLVDAKLLKNQ